MAKNSCNSLTTERKIEINGRVTLPKKICEKMNLSVGDMVSILMMIALLFWVLALPVHFAAAMKI